MSFRSLEESASLPALQRFSRHPKEYGDRRGAQWSEVAIQRFLNYDVFLHELGHLQVVDSEPEARAGGSRTRHERTTLQPTGEIESGLKGFRFRIQRITRHRRKNLPHSLLCRVPRRRGRCRCRKPFVGVRGPGECYLCLRAKVLPMSPAIHAINAERNGDVSSVEASSGP
jgi:hypothetical protein